MAAELLESINEGEVQPADMKHLWPQHLFVHARQQHKGNMLKAVSLTLISAMHGLHEPSLQVWRAERRAEEQRVAMAQKLIEEEEAAKKKAARQADARAKKKAKKAKQRGAKQPQKAKEPSSESEQVPSCILYKVRVLHLVIHAQQDRLWLRHQRQTSLSERYPITF